MKQEQIKQTLEQALNTLCQQHGYDAHEFTSGHCAALALALFRNVAKHYPAVFPHTQLAVLYRIERFHDTDMEDSRCMSHVMLEVNTSLGRDHLDIHGWGADDRWNQYIDENIEPDDDCYNDVAYDDLSGEHAERELMAICALFGSPMDRVDRLTNQLDAIFTAGTTQRGKAKKTIAERSSFW